MDTSNRKQWIRVVLLLGALYFIVNFASSRLGAWPVTNSMAKTWNRLGFLISAVAFALHIGYEHFRLTNHPRTTALHIALAVALGAFGLAIAANLHGYLVSSSNQRSLAFALVAWPALTGLPAFLIALICASVLRLARLSTGARKHL
jgi:uncharacterized protein (DUF486 family)